MLMLPNPTTSGPSLWQNVQRTFGAVYDSPLQVERGRERARTVDEGHVPAKNRIEDPLLPPHTSRRFPQSVQVCMRSRTGGTGRRGTGGTGRPGALVPQRPLV
jgi:hypothetical protein